MEAPIRSAGRAPAAAGGGGLALSALEAEPVQEGALKRQKPPLTLELGAQFRAQKRDFLGIGLSCMSDREFLEAISEAVHTRSRLVVSFINPDYVARAHKSPELMEMINDFDIVLPDGWGVVLGGRWLDLPVPDRQGNDDICPKVFSISAQLGFSNFLFGCREGIPERAAANLTSVFPRLPIAGTLHGYWDVVRGHPGRYDESDIDTMVDAINASGADVLHVCIPTPMQQTWVWQVADRLDVPVIITGGSYLDHLAERVYWYPRWTGPMRLSWAYRLYREPRRLWRRYTLDLMAFGGILVRAKRRNARRPQTITSAPQTISSSAAHTTGSSARRNSTST